MAGGNYGGGTGTLSDPYLVEDIADLATLATVAKFFKLANDIDASKEAMAKAGIFTDGKGWVPVGSSSIPVGHASYAGFKGLDFNFKKIKNLYINRPSEDYVGFLGHVHKYNYNQDIVIKRPYFEGADILGGNYVGILCGYSGNGATSSYVFIDGACCKGKVKGIDFVGGAFGAARFYNVSNGYIKISIS